MKGESHQLLVLQVVAIFTAIIYRNSLRNRHYLTRQGLYSPKFSPWKKLLNCGSNNCFLEMTGFTFEAFRSLTEALFNDELMGIGGARSVGRPTFLNYEDQIGLYLYFVNSTCKIKHLCQIFGIIPSSAKYYINNMMRRVVRKLKRNAIARVKAPNEAEMANYAQMVFDRDTVVRDVIGFMDGLSIPVQCSDDVFDQNAYYNGYHCETMVQNIFVFYPTGKVGFACINFPGSWHDTTVADDIIEWAIRNLGEYKICVDQGFPRGGKLLGKFVGPLKESVRQNLSPILRDILIDLHNRYTSLRQASEWGMRALQGSFSRLKSRLTSNKVIRYHIILSIVLLHNYRTELVGLNQIATVFDHHYEQYINLENYDRIARYYEAN